jgi:prevent-host-death family protein
MPDQVGIRELRQNLSAYLRRVKDGEEFLVTEHNKPVAELTPIRSDADRLRERLIREHGIIPATRSIDDLPPPLPFDRPGGTAALLDEQRAEKPR